MTINAAERQATNNEAISPKETLENALEKFTSTFESVRTGIENKVRDLFKRGANESQLKNVYNDFTNDFDRVNVEVAAAHLDLIRNNEPLNSELLHNPSTLIGQEIIKHHNNVFITFGENHHALGTLQYEGQLLLDLNKQGIKVETVFLEEDEGMQKYVDEYMATGKMPKTLYKYLTTGFVRTDSAVKHTAKIDILENARELGTKVKFLDENDNKDRDADWFNKIDNEIGGEIKGTYILYAGLNHATKKMGPEPIPNKFGGFTFGRTVGDYLNEKFPDQVVSVIGETIDDIHPTGHRYQSIPSRLLVRDLKNLNRSTEASAVILKDADIGEFPISTVKGRTARAKDEFDIMVISPGPYIIDSHKRR